MAESRIRFMPLFAQEVEDILLPISIAANDQDTGRDLNH
jgi:hypothetical protein